MKEIVSDCVVSNVVTPKTFKIMEKIDFENISKEELKQSLRWYVSSCKNREKYDEAEIEKAFMKGIEFYEDACEVLGRKPCIPKQMRKHGYSNRQIALRMLSEIIYALNGMKHVRVCNKNIQHWSPRFRFNGANQPMVFSRSVCGIDELSMGNSTCMTLKSKALSDYCGKKFIKLWREAIL